VINALVGTKLPRRGDFVSVGAIFLSFLLSLRIFNDFWDKYNTDSYIHKIFNWIDLGTGASALASHQVLQMGIYIDNLTAIMLLMVTGVATLIHVFSTYYMEEEERYTRFFTYMSLFTSAMIGLVLSDNLISVFIFWELMGFCSYALIGFYTEKEKAGYASMKAFLTTRIGDVIFLLGIVAIWSAIGSVNFVDIYKAISLGSFEGLTVAGISLATFSAFCIFCGTIGKSAQFPLQIWLPDAMMGPTPCSALIHAATMVAAGVYLSLRVFPLIELGGLSTFVAYTGAITAFIAASIALVQTDIKAVLAYSTISQLGYMVLGIGVGSYTAAFMHLITHAVFKACLFLSAGSVIHSLHDPDTHDSVQDMRLMGGLMGKLRFTHLAMLLSTLAIAGVPFFSGFVSKDRILGDALYWSTQGAGQWYHLLPMILGFITALMTPYYMFRMMVLTFYGKPRNEKIFKHCHEEHLQLNSNVPLLILSVFTLGFIYCGSIAGTGHLKLFSDKYEYFKVLVKAPAVKKFEQYSSQEFSAQDDVGIVAKEQSHYEEETGYFGPNLNHENLHHAHSTSAIVSVLLAMLGIALAFFLHSGRKIVYPEMFSVIGRFLENKWGLDTFLCSISQKATRHLYNVSKWTDEVIVDSVLVDGSAIGTSFFGLIARFLQSGRLQHYFIIMFLIISIYLIVL
jgi:NADH-quinone oxidoreductase subunit L